MNNNIDLELLKRLTAAFGVSGCEGEVRQIIEDEICSDCDSVVTDRLGNLIAVKKAEKADRTVMLMANMDEPGFIIERVKEGGGAFLGFSAVGKIHPHTVMSERVTVGEKRLPGVISLKAVHLTTKEEREKPIKLKDLFIDVGAADKSEIDVTIGDYAAFESCFTELGENGLCDKAIACRACCAILIELLRGKYTNCNLVCVFTIQRESGLRGSKIDFTKYIDLVPDCCIVLDAVEGEKIKLGGGVVVPNLINNAIADREVAAALNAARGNTENNCAVKKVDSDIGSTVTAGAGQLSAELDIPALNMGTPSVIIDKRDTANAIETLKKFLSN